MFQSYLNWLEKIVHGMFTISKGATIEDYFKAVGYGFLLLFNIALVIALLILIFWVPIKGLSMLRNYICKDLDGKLKLAVESESKQEINKLYHKIQIKRAIITIIFYFCYTPIVLPLALIIVQTFF